MTRNWILGFFAIGIWVVNYLVYFAPDIRDWYRRRRGAAPPRSRRPEPAGFTGPLPPHERMPFPPSPRPSPPPPSPPEPPPRPQAEVIPFPRRLRPRPTSAP